MKKEKKCNKNEELEKQACNCEEECNCGDDCECEDCSCEHNECSCQCENDEMELLGKRIKELEETLLRNQAELINYKKRKDEEAFYVRVRH